MSRFSKGFSISELFSNSSGKTSGSGVAGFLTVLVGLLSFIAGVVFTYITCFHNCDSTSASAIMTQSIALIGIGSALLGVRKVAKDKGMTINEEIDIKDDEEFKR